MVARVYLIELLLRNDDFAIYGNEKKGKNLIKIFNSKNEVLALIPYDFDLGCLTGKQNCVDFVLLGSAGREDSAKYLRRLSALDCETCSPSELLKWKQLFRDEIGKMIKTQDAIKNSIRRDSPMSDQQKRAMTAAIQTFMDAGAMVLRERN